MKVFIVMFVIGAFFGDASFAADTKWSKLTSILNVKVSTTAVVAGSRVYIGGEDPVVRKARVLRLENGQLTALSFNARKATDVLIIPGNPGGKILWTTDQGGIWRHDPQYESFTKEEAPDNIEWLGLAANDVSSLVYAVGKVGKDNSILYKRSSNGVWSPVESYPNFRVLDVVWAGTLGWFLLGQTIDTVLFPGTDPLQSALYRINDLGHVLQIARPARQDDDNYLLKGAWVHVPGWAGAGRFIMSRARTSDIWSWDNTQMLAPVYKMHGAKIFDITTWNNRVWYVTQIGSIYSGDIDLTTFSFERKFNKYQTIAATPLPGGSKLLVFMVHGRTDLGGIKETEAWVRSP